ncbi:MAG: hypothetical protein ACREFO_06905 [Acetobacteraceae bacterium]
MGDSPITLELLGSLIRQVQADQRNIRTEMEAMRALITNTVPSMLFSFQNVLLNRLAQSESLIEARFDRLEMTLTDIVTRRP